MTDSTLHLNVNNIAADTILQDIPTVHDTCTVSVTGTTVVSVADMPNENQPNGWLQLLLPVAFTLFVVFLDKWVTRCYARKDEKEAHKRYRETVLDWIVRMEPIERVFSESVNNLSTAIGQSDDMQPLAYAMPLTLHDKLNDMTVMKMTDAFLMDYKEDRDKRYAHMYNIISNMEFLSKITDSVRESYDSYNKQSFALCNEWNKAYMAFIERYNTFSKGNPYEKTVMAWLVSLLKTPNSIKIHLTCLTVLNDVAFNEKDYDTLSLVNKMLHVAKQSQATSAGFSKVFSDVASNINLSLNSLMDAEKFFREN